MFSCNLSAVVDEKSPYISIKSVGSCTVLSLAFIFGVPGNISVMWSIYGKLKNISVTVLLIGHLALADFLILLTLPIWIYMLAVNKWVFGQVFCKVLAYVIYSNLYVSVFLITLLSIERFLAVFRPFQLQKWIRQRVFQKITIFIWIASALLGIHSIPFLSPIQNDQPFKCVLHEYTSNTQKVAFILLETFVGFLIPFCIIIVCYIYLWRKLREMKFVGKRKTDKIIVMVVGTYVICWIPYHIFNIVDVASVLLGTCSLQGIVDIGGTIAGALVFINSCLNPLFYFYYAFKMKSPTKIFRLNMLFENIFGMETEQNPSENKENTTERTNKDIIEMASSDLQMA
ncbi:leukotriene B4 receptor 1-like [Hyla sarda]|uniref:leukotriene B4 receptor 1-like n=1 Tax=Hyla sarda TaxID=327740 RepID=UPI0024C2EE08|nr:leukotriene B4 receptor 1-like [Hyla sarda]XP_056382302.1 leukotriene B4 receptor 1-like [Hyla sarda]